MKSNTIKQAIFGAVALSAFLFSSFAIAQTGTSRQQLQEHDLSVPGREVVQSIVTIAEGGSFPRHKHPGEEIIYVLQGVLEYQVEGQPATTLKAGDVLFVPAETVHSVKNVGKGDAKELATYVVKKGVPMLTLDK
ncbi:cupin domain-containing protein [Taibaiella soli]|uniref:Cupin domain-containing protein n=1 Tax=Taibaiella soli TaxID=1649169 RepID=A0A2W2AI44_9BACT|nr:cupin domain-containing protein [Taibaiella soli]PZF71880.1 cupin domain-containing protein [Taibaiella soli]